ncbi:MAG: hypothetical protein JOZ73_06950 [Solirubrobacterales bacterium]|nr:hypothetical protein [Solirubrobacterales bacterium]
MHRVLRLALLVAAAAILVPAGAFAGKKVTVGDQTLQIKARLKPSKANARNVTLRFESINKSTTPGAQPKENTRQVILLLPKGARLNPKAVTACKRSDLDKSKGNPSVCPKGSQIGSGTVVVNASPLFPKLITGTVTIYNAVNNTGENSEPVGTRNLVLFISTSIGVKTNLPFRVEKSNGRVKLVATMAKPSKPGYQPGNYTIQDVKLSAHGKSKKPFFTNPAKCTKKGWVFTFTITNYFGQKSITAKDRQRCRK